nr:NADH dehydrogenase subunit 5 [Ujna puerana]
MINFKFYFFWFLFMLFSSFSFFYMSILFMLIDKVVYMEWVVLSLNSVNIYYVMIFDWLCLLFISLVMFISSMVILYSIDYMSINSFSSKRFLVLVNLFILSMILMIISPNLLSILLGWDGLGLVSYCLVIYYSSVSSYLAGMITCLTNRLGDIGLLICISWCISLGSWHFLFYNNLLDDLFVYLLVFSCFTKSAQIPFSCWLPAAMAAPTPVSSLVHSSTLVTAGVYLLIRFFNQFSFNNHYFLFLGLMTMIFSSICANMEFDLKKIIALSTLSQLGLMMTSLFLGLVNLSFFHLVTHAVFKSLLFLCAGIYIYYMNDNQDIRFMGSVSKMLPFTSCCFNISNLSLCGTPFLSGFYSKDLILEQSVFFSLNLFVYMLLYFSLGLTCCYTIRLIYYSFIFDNKFILSLTEESFNFMKVSIFILSSFSIFFGCMIMWLINLDLIYIMFPFMLKIKSVIMILFGFWLGLEVFSFNNYLFNLNYYLFNGNMWYLFGYSNYLFLFTYKMSNLSFISMNWGEYYGGMGVGFYLLNLSNYFQFYTMNMMNIFMLTFFVWFLIMIN